jgi:hypothetical protein
MNALVVGKYATSTNIIVVIHCKRVLSSYTNQTEAKMRILIKRRGDKTVKMIVKGYLYKPNMNLILGEYSNKTF